MLNLLRKELRLAVHPTSWIFLGLSLMLLIPSYPYYVAFFYTGLGIFFTCLSARENQDISYIAESIEACYAFTHSIYAVRERHVL